MVRPWSELYCPDCHTKEGEAVFLYPLFKKPIMKLLLAIRYCPQCGNRFEREEKNPLL